MTQLKTVVVSYFNIQTIYDELQMHETLNTSIATRSDARRESQQDML